MTDEVMKARLSALTGETDDNILLTFLDIAAEKVLAKCYPYRHDKRSVPARYHNTQLEIAVYLLNKRGAEGETAHNENGVIYNGTTHYTSANASTAKTCKGGKAKITQIYQLGKSKHPYHLVRVSGSGATVYGWVNAGTFTKA